MSSGQKHARVGVQLHALYGIGTMYFAPSGVLYLSLEANPVTEMVFGMVLIKLECTWMLPRRVGGTVSAMTSMMNTGVLSDLVSRRGLMITNSPTLMSRCSSCTRGV